MPQGRRQSRARACTCIIGTQPVIPLAMPNTASEPIVSVSSKQRPKQSAPLTRPATQKMSAQERAKRNLLAQRQAWNIEEIIAIQEADVPRPQVLEEGPQWANLLDAATKHSVSSWISLDKALAPFSLGVSGPMNPKTGQYLTEIRMLRDHDQQVERVSTGIETLRPFLKIYRGAYEFRIKCLGSSTRDKNWLSLTKDGKARVVSSVRPEVAFDELRAALEFILEHRPAG